ncbi:hypothetical protein [Caldicellulosiruptor morganii]|uniref:Uncharacterized protein n=1 Tax=Caldicellulosiruptor morganii TaxID=1387555 RepID=A0ABY7BL05_9FIRM|nr:hypothetical protein [Caldicellulosiruptor morganii]WAM33269.1 hypothetical protein OTK00_001762 [Caldicellulosiruptor morganii]
MFNSLKQKYYRFGDEKALEQMKRIIESNPDLKAQYIELCKTAEDEIKGYKDYATQQQLKEIEAALIFLDKERLKEAIQALKQNVAINFFGLSENTTRQEQEQKSDKKVLQFSFSEQRVSASGKHFVIKSKKPLDISKTKEAFTDFRCEMCKGNELVYVDAIGAFVCPNCFPQTDVAIRVKSYMQPMSNEYIYELYPIYRYPKEDNFKDNDTKTVAAI